MAYTTKRIKYADIDDKLMGFLARAAYASNHMYGNKYNIDKLNIGSISENEYLWVCFRDDEPVGLLLASLGSSFFDRTVRILTQYLLYCKPNTRASYYLLKTFIDFGRLNANHLITMIGSETNIKPRTLERLGFNKLETLYRMEC